MVRFPFIYRLRIHRIPVGIVVAILKLVLLLARPLLRDDIQKLCWSEFEISSWRGARVDVRTYLLGGAIDGSEANGIIRNPKLELESSRFTFDLVPLSYESVDVVVGKNWLLRHKAELVCHEKVIKMPWSSKVRVGSNGNLLWEASVLLGRKKGCVMDTLKFIAMPFGLTNAPAVFMELMSRSKEEYESHVKMIAESLKEEKMYVKFSNNVEAEQRGSYLDVEGIKWVMSRSWHYQKEQTIS
ncbi:putative reverse transcriptase domain-containing protein [Tanacetum coccineum]